MLKRKEFKAEENFMDGSSIPSTTNFKNVSSWHRHYICVYDVSSPMGREAKSQQTKTNW